MSQYQVVYAGESYPKPEVGVAGTAIEAAVVSILTNGTLLFFSDPAGTDLVLGCSPDAWSLVVKLS